jgi:hypothetical protein
MSMHSPVHNHGAVVDAVGTAVVTPIDLAELVCDDPELLRREFDELIAASWDGLPPDPPPGPRPCRPGRPAPYRRRARRRRPAAVSSAAGEAVPAAPARERGPPTAVVRPQETAERWWFTWTYR